MSAYTIEEIQTQLGTITDVLTSDLLARSMREPWVGWHESTRYQDGAQWVVICRRDAPKGD